MSRKHFEGIAKALKESQASEATCYAMAAFCATQNANFDRARFLKACGW